MKTKYRCDMPRVKSQVSVSLGNVIIRIISSVYSSVKYMPIRLLKSENKDNRKITAYIFIMNMNN